MVDKDLGEERQISKMSSDKKSQENTKLASISMLSGVSNPLASDQSSRKWDIRESCEVLDSGTSFENLSAKYNPE